MSDIYLSFEHSSLKQDLLLFGRAYSTDISVTISASILVLPKMLSKTGSIDLNTGHGNILGCAEVVYALRLWTEENTK